VVVRTVSKAQVMCNEAKSRCLRREGYEDGRRRRRLTYMSMSDNQTLD
jgi:hypothetical protein